ncbi:MAG: hypothetical protein ACOYOL_07130 [Chthoniobacterales bacterium]
MGSYRTVQRTTITVGAATPVKIIDGTLTGHAGWRVFNSTVASLQFKLVDAGGAAPALADFNGASGYPDFENISSGDVIEDGCRGGDVYCLSLSGTVSVIAQRLML